MRKQKLKKVLIGSLVSLLAIGTLGTSLSFFGRDDFNKAKDTIKDAFVKEEDAVVTKNILCNTDFQVNTTGKSVFTQADISKVNDLCVNGWASNTTANDTFDFVLMPVEDGLYAKLSETQNGEVRLLQHITAEKVLGKTLTLSFSVNNVVYTNVFYFDVAQREVLYSNSGLNFAIISSADTETSGVVSFIVGFKPSFEGVLNWVQLEVGDVFTGYAQGSTSYTSPFSNLVWP